MIRNLTILLFGLLLTNTSAHAEYPEADLWSYDAETRITYRVNADYDVECFSYDGVNCIRRDSKDQIDFDRAPIIPLACGGDHLEHWRVLGYDNSGHWCGQLWERSGANDWKLSEKHHIYYRHTIDGFAECWSAFRSNECWDMTDFYGVTPLDPGLENTLRCSFPYTAWGHDEVEHNSNWCQDLNKPWAEEVAGMIG